MEAQARLPLDPVVPSENDWPSVPQEPFKAPAGENGLSPMNIEKPPLGELSDGSSRDNGGLSMDDIAAAQVLEDLRAGNEPLRVVIEATLNIAIQISCKLNPGSPRLYPRRSTPL